MNEALEQLFNKAHQLQRKGLLKEAVVVYEQLLSLNPRHKQALHFLGLCYAQLGQSEQAITTLKEALVLDPKNASIYNNLGNSYKMNKQPDEARINYQRAIELLPNYAQAHHNLATLYALDDNYKLALQHYSQAVHAEPDFAAAHFNLGLLLLKHHELAAAKIQFNNVLTLNPSYPEAAFYLGLLCLEENQLDEADAYFQEVIDQNSNHTEALTNLGVIALKREENQQAIDYFTKALALDNNHLDARNNLAATFMHHDRFENALMHYDVLLQQEPNNIEYLYNSGVAQMALGHLTEAMLHFEKILNQDEKHFASLNNLASIYLRMDDKTMARELLERAVASNPQDESSQHMLTALSQTKTAAATSPSYAANLFNNYALYYEQHMQRQLHYSLPQHLASLIHQLNLTDLQQTIDLGCGTGFSAPVLREISKKLIGVDIAAKMLAEAKKKGLYDQLIEAELVHFLQEETECYDFALAADVLPYLGDLEPLFSALTKRLISGGYFIFSTEITEVSSWHLQETARFSHKPAYIQELCSQHDLALIQQKSVKARQQNEQALSVMLYIAQKKS